MRCLANTRAILHHISLVQCNNGVKGGGRAGEREGERDGKVMDAYGRKGRKG